MSKHDDMLNQAYDLIQEDKFDEANKILSTVVKEDPMNADAWWLMANAVEEPKDARRALVNVVKYDPSHERAQEMLNQLNEMYPPQTPDEFAMLNEAMSVQGDDFDFDDNLFGEDNELPDFGEEEDPFADLLGEQPTAKPKEKANKKKARQKKEREKSSSGGRRRILLILLVVVLVGAGAVALLSGGGDDGDSGSDETAETTDATESPDDADSDSDTDDQNELVSDTDDDTDTTGTSDNTANSNNDNTSTDNGEDTDDQMNNTEDSDTSDTSNTDNQETDTTDTDNEEDAQPITAGEPDAPELNVMQDDTLQALGLDQFVSDISFFVESDPIYGPDSSAVGVISDAGGTVFIDACVCVSFDCEGPGPENLSSVTLRGMQTIANSLTSDSTARNSLVSFGVNVTNCDGRTDTLHRVSVDINDIKTTDNQIDTDLINNNTESFKALWQVAEG